MTRFLYIADTHLGAAPMGYRQQPGYPERLGEIVRALRRIPTNAAKEAVAGIDSRRKPQARSPVASRATGGETTWSSIY